MFRATFSNFIKSINDKRVSHTRSENFIFYTKLFFLVLIPFVYLFFIILYINHLDAVTDYGVAMTIVITFLLLSWLALFMIYRTIILFYYGRHLYNVTVKTFRTVSLALIFVVFIIPISFFLTILYLVV